MIQCALRTKNEHISAYSALGTDALFLYHDICGVAFSIFASLEPISDSAHTLGVIDDAMDQLDALKGENFIDTDGRDIRLSNYNIEFRNVDFGYDSRKILKNVSFSIPEKTSTAIVGPSGSGKTTICSLIARFYDPQSGSITVGGHDLHKFTCDSLLSNISMVFQGNTAQSLCGVALKQTEQNYYLLRLRFVIFFSMNL